MRWLLASTFLVALSLPAHAGILWKDDFESGNLSKWSSKQIVSADRMQFVESPVREGRKSLRVVVRQGDDPINSSGNRNELLYHEGFKDGDQAFYRWSTFFPSSFPSVDKWQIFIQFHHTGCCGSPPVEFYVRGERLNLRVGGDSGKVVWSGPLERAAWQDFILQIRWSPNASVGRVALWHQGKQVLAPVAVATRYPGEGSYMKLGLYRDASIAPEGVLFHDNMTIATSLEDVLTPGDGNPGDGNPGDGNPGDGNPGDGNPGDGNPGDGNPGDGNPDDGNPDDGNPGGNPDDGNPDDGNGNVPPPPTDDGSGSGVVQDPELAASCSAAPTAFSSLGLLGGALVLTRLRRRRKS